MDRTDWNYWKKHFLYGIILTAWFMSAACGRWLDYAVFRFPVFSIDDRTETILTSTDYRFPKQFEKTLGKYKGFGELYRKDDSFAIPGLVYTDLGAGFSANMVPQGICVAENYVLITAYDRTKKANSVIYVLSNCTGLERVFLTTMVLPDRNHVGGIAFDGENIWVAKSSTGYLSRISLDTIDEAVCSGIDAYQLTEYEENVYCGITASFVTCYDGRVWVGTYCSKADEKGTLSCFLPLQDREGTELLLEGTIEIPTHAQGVAFLEDRDTTYMMLSTSYGRYRDSKMYLYELTMCDSDVKLAERGQYCFPPMTEELVSDGDNIYVLFESAATCYSTEQNKKCAYPIDRVCAISLEKLLKNI